MDAGILESFRQRGAMDVLAANLRRLRKQAHLTQAELAARAELPRATLASLEQPGANPSMATVVAVARALAVSLDELLAPRADRRVVVVPPREQQEFRADHGRFTARLSSPITSKGVQIQQVALQPGCDSLGRPHPLGAQEFFLVLHGTARVRIDDDEVELGPGALVQFPGHRRHTYGNPGRETAQAVSIVVMNLG
jgi:transcriptional regulator with XRE-family HTH domain